MKRSASERNGEWVDKGINILPSSMETLMAKNLKQLLAQIEKLQSQADALKNKERVGVIARIQEAVAHYGITTAELFEKPARKTRAVAGERAQASKRHKVARKAPARGVGQPKYHDGTGRTWTGRGKRPAWFVEALAEGRTAESMLINQG